MDGSDLTVLIDRKIGWPNGLTIDYASKKLFWVDARLDTIEYADLDGKNRQIILQGKVPHPFGITLFEDEIFWTDWLTKAIYKAHKWSGKNHMTLKNTTRKPMDIQVRISSIIFVYITPPIQRPRVMVLTVSLSLMATTMTVRPSSNFDLFMSRIKCKSV